MKRVVLLCILALAIFIGAPLIHAKEVGTGVSADAAISMLKDGNHRFVIGKQDHPNQGFDRRDSTAQKGQKPFASVLSCSDSRVPVEALFDQGIGDIFVIRVAGNVANVDEVASIEYGADHLGTPVVVVLGHTQCGAVTAVAKGEEVHGHIPTLVKNIGTAVDRAKKDNPKAKGEELVNAAITANVWQGVEDLIKSSPILAGRVKEGKLRIIGAIYTIDTGKVNWLGPHPKQDQLLSAAKTEKKH
jgi:carbonic anhydrase